MLPKVLVGCPVSDHGMYSVDKYLAGIKALTYPHFDLLLVDNSKEDIFFKNVKERGIPIERISYSETARDRLVRSRNVLVERILQGKYDYLLSLEFDVIPPPDVIQRLLAHRKKVISGVYFKPVEYTYGGKVVKKEIAPVAFKSIGNSKWVSRMTYDEVKDDKLVEIRTVGLGCMLISRAIFEEGVRFRYEEGKEVFDDTFFCYDVRNIVREKVFMDTSVKCVHLVKDKSWENIKK